VFELPEHQPAPLPGRGNKERRHMSTGAQPFDDLPYADQYLRDILRPRVERAIQLVDRSMTESVWQHVVRMLAAEQPSGNEETPVMIRRMLEERLGLRLEARIDVAFTGMGEQPSPQHAAGQTPEVVVRPSPLPLVNAVLAGTRRSGK
jgi:hypothetical protein